MIDAETGAVHGVVVTALHAGRRAGGFAVPLRAPAEGGALADALARNAATVPAYGPHLNIAGALRLTATSVASAARPRPWREAEARPDTEAELAGFTEEGCACVLGLVGAPGSGRTTALEALAVRRAAGLDPAPTLWLRGAELRAGDAGLRDAVARALAAAGRIVHAGRVPERAPADASPDAVARLAHAVGRRLLVVLDAPEEMPPLLAHALREWSAETARWLGTAGARLIVACRPEYWEQAGALFPPGLLHDAGTPPGARALPACLRLGGLAEEPARLARERHGLSAGALAEQDAAHPLALRLLSEVRAAGGGLTGRPGRAEVFSAHLDLLCLRIAHRIAAATAPARATEVRRLAARVAGQVHEAARRCLGPGQGELDRASFEELFPWRPGWAAAVLTEGLVVPAGAGYRFAHEEFGDWLQGGQLDLDEALYALVHRWSAGDRDGCAEAPCACPPGPGRSRGTGPCRRCRPRRRSPRPPSRAACPCRGTASARSCRRCCSPPAVRGRTSSGAGCGNWSRCSTATPPRPRRAVAGPYCSTGCPGRAGRATPSPGRRPGARTRCGGRRTCWGRPCSGCRTRPRTGTCCGCWRSVSPSVRSRPGASTRARGWGSSGRGSGGGCGSPEERLALLRLLLPADGPPRAADGTRERFLTAAGEVLAATPRPSMPALCGWFTDERLLQSAPSGPRPTVATAAQALLHTHRRQAVDDLTEALAATDHPRAKELLAALAEDEPSAVCRAVDRWAHEDRPERHAAAATYGLLAAPHAVLAADRELLRYAALAILARPADRTLHGAALGLLVRDPATRCLHLRAALDGFAAGDPLLPAAALAAALPTHPEQVLAAFHSRLREPGPGAAEVLRELAEVSTPALARRAAALVWDHLGHRPEDARHAAAYLDRRLEHGPAARAVLLPLVTGLLREHPPQVRRVLAPVLAAPGGHVSRPLRQELLDVLLDQERDPAVLDALLGAAADGCARRPAPMTRDLVHRVGLLLCRTPEGAALFDRRLVQLVSGSPGFARQVRGWLAADGLDGAGPGAWDAVIGPSARRMCDQLAPAEAVGL